MKRNTRRAGRSDRRGSIGCEESLEPRIVMSAGSMQIGMNLDNVNDYTPTWQFTDLFQSSRPWISHAYNTVTGVQDFHGGTFVPVQTDENGWPTRLATWNNAHGHLMQQRLGTLMFNNLNGAYPSGVYRVEWEGAGEVIFAGDARETTRGATADGRRFALLNVVAQNEGIYLGIRSLSPDDPIRNIHVWMPDFNGQSFSGQVWQPSAAGQNGGSSPFHPLYRERLADFGILRFMQAQETNTSDIQMWSDRRDARDSRQSSGNGGSGFVNGMSVEHMVQLANDLDADPWFNMPHLADDTFVRNFAIYVRENLKPGLTAYVEWSNEIWNFSPGFEATSWVVEQTRLPLNEGLTHWQIAGREAARDMNIWSEVFSSQPGRIVRVAGGQASTPWVTERIVESMGGSFDAIAIAPYFEPTEAQRSAYSSATTVDQVFADLRGNILSGAQATVGHQRLADDYSTRLGRDIRLLAYEGGQHLDGRGASYQNVFFAATKDPRMAELTREYLQIQNATGMDAYVHYKLSDRDIPGRGGNLGVLNRQDQPISEAHVYRTLLEAAAGTLFSTGPTLVTLNSADLLAHETGSGRAAFRVSRGGDLSRPLTVQYSVSGTATAGLDYAALTGNVTFEAGERTAVISVVPSDDAAVESNETVVVTLQPGPGYSLISPATSTDSISILSDDVATNLPIIQITASDATAAEANRDPGVFTVTRSGGKLTASLTVNLQTGIQTAGTADYDAFGQSVVFAPGQVSATLIVRPADDAAIENTETVVMSLRPSLNYRLGVNSEARIRILDNDFAPPPVTPVISVAATDAEASEVGGNNGVFTLTRSGSLNNSLLVRYTAAGTATGGGDYAALSGFAFFAYGAATTTVTVRPVNDPTVEPTETVVLTLTDGDAYDVGVAGVATVSLLSEDVDPGRLNSRSAVRTGTGNGSDVRQVSTGLLNRPADMGGRGIHAVSLNAPLVSPPPRTDQLKRKDSVRALGSRQIGTHESGQSVVGADGTGLVLAEAPVAKDLDLFFELFGRS